MLRCFELSLILKVNFSKTKIGGVGVEVSKIQRFFVILNCEVMDLPFTYSRILIGGNQRISL